MNYPIPKSTYQHYKGNFYEVFCLAKCSETDEYEKYFVIYQCMATGTIYSRPLESFCEEVNGVPRFKLYFNALCKNNEELVVGEDIQQQALDYLEKTKNKVIDSKKSCSLND